MEFGGVGGPDCGLREIKVELTAYKQPSTNDSKTSIQFLSAASGQPGAPDGARDGIIQTTPPPGSTPTANLVVSADATIRFVAGSDTTVGQFLFLSENAPSGAGCLLAILGPTAKLAAGFSVPEMRFARYPYPEQPIQTEGKPPVDPAVDWHLFGNVTRLHAVASSLRMSATEYGGVGGHIHVVARRGIAFLALQGGDIVLNPSYGDDPSPFALKFEGTLELRGRVECAGRLRFAGMTQHFLEGIRKAPTTGAGASPLENGTLAVVDGAPANGGGPQGRFLGVYWEGTWYGLRLQN